MGLALAIKGNLQPVLVDQTPNWIMCKVKLAETEVYIVNVYFPSGNEGVPIIRTLRLRLEALGTELQEGSLLMMGDFNRNPEEVDQICWRFPITLTRAKPRGHPGTFTDSVVSFTPTAIDHILMGPVGAGILEAKVLRRWSDSDHWPMSAALNLRVVNSPGGKQAHSSSQKRD